MSAALSAAQAWPREAASINNFVQPLRLFLEAADCHSYCPCHDRDRYQYDKRLIYYRFFRCCHCHPPRTDASERHIPPKKGIAVSVAANVAKLPELTKEVTVAPVSQFGSRNQAAG